MTRETNRGGVGGGELIRVLEEGEVYFGGYQGAAPCPIRACRGRERAQRTE